MSHQIKVIIIYYNQFLFEFTDISKIFDLQYKNYKIFIRNLQKDNLSKIVMQSKKIPLYYAKIKSALINVNNADKI